MSVQARSYPLPLAPAELAACLPCSHGAGCPLGVDAPAIANAVLAGDHARAHRIARGPNPFASSCGHGCHAPCETACRRGAHGAPVAISKLEAYAANFSVPTLLASPEPCTSAHDVRSVSAFAAATRSAAAPRSASGARVAIVGAGVAGLACAHDLALLGHSCTIFDARAEPGGVLTSVLPTFRFPMASTRAECAAILAMGGEFRGEVCIDAPHALRSLRRQGFQAVFLGIGAMAPRGTVIEEPAPDLVLDAMALLTSSTPLAGRVVVAGDNQLAVDAARVLARRSGATGGDPLAAVHLVLPTSLEHSAIAPAMLAAAAREGVIVHHGWRVHRIYSSSADGCVTAVELVRPGQTSRVIPCDHVVDAAPRVPGLGALAGELACTEQGFIATDPEALRTSCDGVWAGGACAFGHRSIAHAAADGKRAAWSIHASLAGVAVSIHLSSAWVEADDHRAERTQRALATRRTTPHAPVAPPADPFAIATMPDPAEMGREAARCFDCTVVPHVDETCTACGRCVDVCPVGAFTLDAGAPKPRLDQAPCTRCGLCAERCPEDAIAMVRAVWEERLVVTSAG
ncbi:MAG TPA: FAD-dependent oxidoreductase [Gemmatimonadaceae bacterium]|nr:FAD-dependent oxidoreductase [Gemmatimonadaceae bacterium]